MPLYFTAPHHDCIIAIKHRFFAESSKLPLCPLLPFSRFPICMMSFVMPGFFAYKEAAEKLNYDLFSFKGETKGQTVGNVNEDLLSEKSLNI